jgi:hypothetical protein
MLIYYVFQLFGNNDNNMITNPEGYTAAQVSPARTENTETEKQLAAPAGVSTVYDPAARVAMVVTFGETCFAKNQFGEVLNNITQAQCFFYSDHPSLLSSAREVVQQKKDKDIEPVSFSSSL